MRVLVTWGSKLGGTEGIGRIIAESLGHAGHEVVALPAHETDGVSGYDAVIVGGALYANTWNKAARRFVAKNVPALRKIPVWFFSSGPLDDSADAGTIAPTTQASVLMERVGAVGHVTFGGRLEADVKGMMARSMAKEHAGDWRNPERIRAWGAEVAESLPAAKPRPAIDHPARSPRRLVRLGVVGWALCAAVLLGMMQVASTGWALGLRAVVAPIVFASLAYRYFKPRGALEPLPVALAFTAIVAVLDAAIVSGLLVGFGIFRSVAGTWLPLLLIFGVTWSVGAIMATMPWPTDLPPARKPGDKQRTPTAGTGLPQQA